MKNQKGITMVVLIATVVVMAIIVGTVSYNSINSVKTQVYYNMCSDIELLDEKIALYYIEHMSDTENFGLPINKTVTLDAKNVGAMDSENVNYNPNNKGNLYQIDVTKLDNLTLNYSASKYYIDSQSHTIYFSDGVEFGDETYYTVPVDYQDVSEAVL